MACLVLAGWAAQAAGGTPRFGERVDRGLVEHAPISEASGIVASQKNPGVLWVHNDSGQPNRVFALSSRGVHLGTYVLNGVKNHDWEDIALGPGPEAGRSYLYIGDIGDNRARRDLKYIHRVPEPRVRAGQAAGQTLSNIETISFRYPDGKRDAETLLVDPITKDLYVISKREPQVRVYRAASPQLTTAPITLERVATLALNEHAAQDAWLVGGDISPSGAEILLKSYRAVYYWTRAPGQTVHQALTARPVTLPYLPEPQGEALGWKADGTGYYTVSEERDSVPARLYFYPRLPAAERAPIDTNAGRPGARQRWLAQRTARASSSAYKESKRSASGSGCQSKQSSAVPITERGRRTRGIAPWIIAP